jgi:phosphate transport system substrate-binding protein
MRRSIVKLVGLVTALVCTGVVSAAAITVPSEPVHGKRLAAITITGDGSTFQLNYTQAIIGEFRQRQPKVTVSYEAVGSPRGLDDLANRRVDFAGSDIPFGRESARVGNGHEFLYFPLAVAPISVAYNVPGVSDLQLSPDTIAQIFEGEITTWDAPSIKQENSGVSLPNTPIIVVHRADDSGTTENFTRFLMEAAPAVWTLGSGTTIAWPIHSQAGAGNLGVAQIVSTTEGAVAYLDYPDAHALDLTSASIKNSAGKYVAASSDGAGAALAGALVNGDLTFDPIGSPVPDAYPITAPTWLVVERCQSDPGKAAALRAMLRFAYSAGPQLADDVGYVPLDELILRLAKAQVRQIVAMPC